MDQPSYAGTACADDFRSGTTSAACGGTTTVIPFAMAGQHDPLGQTVAAYRQLADGKALIDYAIHPTIQSVPPGLVDEVLPGLIRGGYASLKIFTTYDGFRLDDRAILEVFTTAAREGALVMVHAENDAIIKWCTQDLLARGLRAPRYVAQARPALAEREAIHRVISLAELTGARVLIVHVSSAAGLAEITAARARGVPVHAETCTQYLTFDERDLDLPELEGARFMCSPPLRRPEDRAALWDGVERGQIAVLSSDHAPSRLGGSDGKLRHGPDSSFAQIAGGLPGLELRLPVLFSEGVGTGRIGLPEFVALTSGNAARLHGIAHRKGGIAIGADADLALWDPNREVTVNHAMLHDQTDFTPYEGRRLKGWPMTTISRGEVVVDDGRVLGAPGRGRFVPALPEGAS